MELNDYLTIVVSILCSVIAAVVSILIAKLNAKKEIENIKEENELAFEKYKAENVYEIKREAIFNTLKFLDTYFSWLTFDDSKRVPIREGASVLDMTLQARICYNELCTTCERQEIVKIFVEIMFDKSKYPYPLGLLNDFRNEARKELGLEKIDLSKDHIFISQISTNDLENYTKQTTEK